MDNTIAQKLEQAGMTQHILAQKIKMDEGYLSKIINNKIDVTITTAKKIARALDCKICDIWPDKIS